MAEVIGSELDRVAVLISFYSAIPLGNMFLERLFNRLLLIASTEFCSFIRLQPD